VPVVLDLGNDGIKIVPLSQSTARFDIAGTGHRQILAWVGPDDALLVYDKDGDRLISERDEIAFADYLANAETDLEGLAWFDQKAQGGNADGILDHRDKKWSDFGVWRDADQDGETDPGELRMTGDGGLTAVNLTSDQQTQDIGTDAKVFGRGEYRFADADGVQRSAGLYDTALRYEDAPDDANRPKTAAEILYPDMRSKASPARQPDPNDPDYILARSIYDHPTSWPQPAPPRLKRRDGRTLSHDEVLYPNSAYDEATHFPWPEQNRRR